MMLSQIGQETNKISGETCWKSLPSLPWPMPRSVRMKQRKKYAREYIGILGVSAHPLLDTVLKARELDHLQCPVDAVLNDDPHWRVQ